MDIVQPKSTGARLVAISAAIDVVAVLFFVALGRTTHDESLNLIGLLTTWWPFLAALAVGWIATVAWLRPVSIVRTGIGVWIITVGLGMVLRVISGQGTALAFIIVAFVAVGILLLGWRAVAAVILRRKSPQNA